jgi:hypothetical protein
MPQGLAVAAERRQLGLRSGILAAGALPLVGSRMHTDHTGHTDSKIGVAQVVYTHEIGNGLLIVCRVET